MTREQTEFLGIAPVWTLTINEPNVDYYDIEYLFDLIKDIRDWQKTILDNCYNGAEILRGLAYVFGIDTGEHGTYEDTLKAVVEALEKEKKRMSQMR